MERQTNIKSIFCLLLLLSISGCFSAKYCPPPDKFVRASNFFVRMPMMIGGLEYQIINESIYNYTESGSDCTSAEVYLTIEITNPTNSTLNYNLNYFGLFDNFHNLKAHLLAPHNRKVLANGKIVPGEKVITKGVISYPQGIEENSLVLEIIPSN